MTEYTMAITKYEERSPFVSLAQARELTHLDLVAARDVVNALDGRSYQQMEEESESKSHQSVRDQGIDFFCSVGFHVFPEGIGVHGTLTFADFLAIRGNRAVFVEVLTDTNVKAETWQRKAQLQKHGELCFILFLHTKRSDEPSLIAAKRSIESWADVLYCRLDRHGNRICRPYKTTVAYDTTRKNGIRVTVTFEQSGRKLAVSARFLTHLYQNSELPCAAPAYLVEPLPACYARIFLEVFQIFATHVDGKIMFTSRHRLSGTAFRAMGRKSGLKMTDSTGRVVACLKFECRGWSTEDCDMWPGSLSSSGPPPGEILGTFVLDRTGPEGLLNLLASMEQFGLSLSYCSEEFEQGLHLLAKQRY
jgi:hypothetical protein